PHPLGGRRIGRSAARGVGGRLRRVGVDAAHRDRAAAHAAMASAGRGDRAVAQRDRGQPLARRQNDGLSFVGYRTYGGVRSGARFTLCPVSPFGSQEHPMKTSLNAGTARSRAPGYWRVTWLLIVTAMALVATILWLAPVRSVADSLDTLPP